MNVYAVGVRRFLRGSREYYAVRSGGKTPRDVVDKGSSSLWGGAGKGDSDETVVQSMEQPAWVEGRTGIDPVPIVLGSTALRFLITHTRLCCTCS